MLVGHEGVRRQLEKELPPVVLLTGLAGTGKWALAEHLARFHCTQWDVELLRSKWGVRAAREAGWFVQQSPLRGSYRAVAADLEQASNAAQTALLKVLEEPPGHARFLLVAPPGVAQPTVVSRAQQFYCQPLTQEQAVAVLVQQGLSGPEAAAAAVLAPGRPGAALHMARDAAVAQERVREVLAAARDGSPRVLDRLFRKWGDPESRMLGTWAWEASTGNWRVFGEQDSPRAGPAGARSIIQSRVLSNSRPQIADRRIIDSAMQQQLI